MIENNTFNYDENCALIQVPAPNKLHENHMLSYVVIFCKAEHLRSTGVTVDPFVHNLKQSTVIFVFLCLKSDL